MSSFSFFYLLDFSGTMPSSSGSVAATAAAAAATPTSPFPSLAYLNRCSFILEILIVVIVIDIVSDAIRRRLV